MKPEGRCPGRGQETSSSGSSSRERYIFPRPGAEAGGHAGLAAEGGAALEEDRAVREGRHQRAKLLVHAQGCEFVWLRYPAVFCTSTHIVEERNVVTWLVYAWHVADKCKCIPLCSVFLFFFAPKLQGSIFFWCACFCFIRAERVSQPYVRAPSSLCFVRSCLGRQPFPRQHVRYTTTPCPALYVCTSVQSSVGFARRPNALMRRGTASGVGVLNKAL